MQVTAVDAGPQIDGNSSKNAVIEAAEALHEGREVTGGEGLHDWAQGQGVIGGGRGEGRVTHERCFRLGSVTTRSTLTKVLVVDAWIVLDHLIEVVGDQRDPRGQEDGLRKRVVSDILVEGRRQRPVL